MNMQTVQSSESRRREPGLQAGKETRPLPPHSGIIERVCDSQAGTCTTWHETAAGHAVAAREASPGKQSGAARPVNREPTARREPRLESPAFRRVEDVKKLEGGAGGEGVRLLVGGGTAGMFGSAGRLANPLAGAALLAC